MSVGGIGGGGGPQRPEEPMEPTGATKPFQLPSSNWQGDLQEAIQHLDPENPIDPDQAVRLLTQLSENPSTPQSVQQAAKTAADQVSQGYLVSKNPMELVQPYLALCNITNPIGPGLSAEDF